MSNKTQDTTAPFSNTDKRQKHRLSGDTGHKRLPVAYFHLHGASRRDRRRRGESRLPGADCRKGASLRMGLNDLQAVGVS